MKLGGNLEVQTTFQGTLSHQPAWSGSSGAQDRYRDYFTTRSRMTFQVDTRTATEYGVVRTFGDMRATFDTLNSGNGTNPNAFVNAATIAGGNGLTNTVSNGYTAVGFLFIQFAGFTFGKSASAYSVPWQSFPGNTSAFLIGSNDSATGVNNIQYSAAFGNGVSAAIGLDEPRVYDRTNLFNVSGGATVFAGSLGTNSYTGNRIPDIVGTIKVDQASFYLQFSAAAHYLSATYWNAANSGTGAADERLGHPDGVWGFAVQGALQIKNIPTGAGDDFKIVGSYADGASKYTDGYAGTTINYLMFSGTSAPGAYQSFGFGSGVDAVFAGTTSANGQSIQKVQSWGVRGAFNHNWDPYWSTAVFGGAAWLHFPGNGPADAIAGNPTAAGLVCAKLTGGVANGFGAGVIGTAGATAVAGSGYSCNPDYAVYQVGLLTRWTPVKNLTFSAEVMYMKLDQNMAGLFIPAVAPGTLAKPIVPYQWKDQDTVSMNVKVQRNF
jgi:hypothetical protein